MFSSIKVVFPNASDTPGIVASYSIRQKKYEHDLMTIVFRNWGTTEAAVKAGSPMIVTLTNGEVERTIYGYVHHFSRKRRADADYTEVVGIGASFVMKQARQTVYANTTASEVAKRIAKAHKFAYNIAPHPRVYPQISQSGLTDWQLLTKLAKQCGYTLRADNATLHFKPVDEEYDRDRVLAPKFFMAGMGMPAKPSIYSFNPLVGDILSFEDAQKAAVAISGHDPVSGAPYALTSKKKTRIRAKNQPELFDRYHTSTVTPNYMAAKYEADASVELNKFPYRARAILRGTPSVKPNMPIYIDGVGDDYNGYWIVLSAEHKMENFNYTTEVEIGVDSLGPSVYEAPSGKIGAILLPSTVTNNSSRVRASLGIQDIVLTANEQPLYPEYAVSVSKVANMSTSFQVSDQQTTEALNKSIVSSSVWRSTFSDVRGASRV